MMEMLKYKGKTIGSLTPTEVRDYSLVVKARENDAALEQAGVLYHINHEALYTEWKYKRFKDYVENELDMKERMAYRRVQVWEYYAITIGDENLLRKMIAEGIGISKLTLLVDVINSENADEWVEKAKKMNRAQLEATCNQLKGGSSTDSSDRISGLKTFQIKLFEDQREIIEAAIEKAKEISEDSSKPELLAFVAQDFVGTNLFKTGDAPKMQLMAYFRKLESILRQYEIVVRDRNTGECIYGVFENDDGKDDDIDGLESEEENNDGIDEGNDDLESDQ